MTQNHPLPSCAHCSSPVKLSLHYTAAHETHCLSLLLSTSPSIRPRPSGRYREWSPHPSMDPYVPPRDIPTNQQSGDHSSMFPSCTAAGRSHCRVLFRLRVQKNPSEDKGRASLTMRPVSRRLRFRSRVDWWCRYFLSLHAPSAAACRVTRRRDVSIPTSDVLSSTTVTTSHEVYHEFCWWWRKRRVGRARDR